MVLRLLPNQIVKVWEAIKFVMTKVDEVEEKNLQIYFNEILHSLLNEKAQCWVRLDKDRILEGMALTRILIDKVTSDKCLLIQCLYSFKSVDDDEWKRSAVLFKQYANKEKCAFIDCYSRNEKIWELATMLGFEEINRQFRLKI